MHSSISYVSLYFVFVFLVGEKYIKSNLKSHNIPAVWMFTTFKLRIRNIYVVYLDYRKAFDSVPHERLLNKIYAYGIRGKLNTWIRNFLLGRTQKVVVEGSVSSLAQVSSGIPQGSVLGSLLFLIYVNDLPDQIKSTVKLFADDTKVYRAIKTEEDRTILQADLQAMMTWSNKWQLPFNTAKCKVMYLGKYNLGTTYTFNVGQVQTDLEKVIAESDLGVKFDNKLSFTDHISEITSKANQRIGLIRRNFKYIDKRIFLILYKSLIRPVLEYCNTVWRPLYKKDSRAIENVQRRATKLIESIQRMDYQSRLKELSLPSMVYRRRRADVLQIFRIINGIDIVEEGKFIQLVDETVTRGHSLKLYKPRITSRIGGNILATRVVNDWNDLSDEVVKAESVNVLFKTRLEEEWANKEWKYEPEFYHGSNY